MQEIQQTPALTAPAEHNPCDNQRELVTAPYPRLDLHLSPEKSHLTTLNAFVSVANAKEYEGDKLIEKKHLKSMTRTCTPPSDLLQGMQSCAEERGSNARQYRKQPHPICAELQPLTISDLGFCLCFP